MTWRSATYIAAVPKRVTCRTEVKREKAGSSVSNQGDGSRDGSKGAAGDQPGAPDTTTIPSFSAWSEAACGSGDGSTAVSATSSLHIISDDPQLKEVWRTDSIPLIVPADDPATNLAISRDATTAPKLERFFPFGFRGDIEVVTNADAPVQVTLRNAEQYSATGELGEMARKARSDTDTLLDALRQLRQSNPSYGRAPADASHHGGRAPTTGAVGGMPRATVGSAPKHPDGAGHAVLHRRPPQQSRPPPPPPPPQSSHLPQPPLFSSSRPPVPAYRSSAHAATAPTAQLQTARSASRPWQLAAATAAAANREAPQSHGDAKLNGDDAQPRLPKHKRLPGIICLESHEVGEAHGGAKRPRTEVNDDVAGSTAAPRSTTKDRAPPRNSAEDCDDDGSQKELLKLEQYIQQCGGSSAMLEGWTVRVKPRPKESTGPKQADVYFHPPAGHPKGTKQHRSMAEVARFLQLKDAPAQRKRKQPAAHAHTNDDDG